MDINRDWKPFWPLQQPQCVVFDLTFYESWWDKGGNYCIISKWKYHNQKLVELVLVLVSVLVSVLVLVCIYLLELPRLPLSQDEQFNHPFCSCTWLRLIMISQELWKYMTLLLFQFFRCSIRLRVSREWAWWWIWEEKKVSNDGGGGDRSGVACVDWLGMELSKREINRGADHTRR